MQGVVKSFDPDEGWGVIVSADVPADVFVHFSAVEGTGFRELAAGDVVEFDVEEAEQTPFRFRAERALLICHGLAPDTGGRSRKSRRGRG